MHTLQVLIYLALVLGGAHGGDQGQTRILDADTQQICSSVADVPLPASDRPDPDERATLAGCSSVDLYFGFGAPPDPVRARKCAYLEMAAGEKEPILGGRAILMMAYANGKGAGRNFDVALKLACAIRGAPQDVAGRVHQLARLKAAHWTGDRFSICDHSSGRAIYEQCAILQDRFDAVERAGKLETITARWTVAERSAFVPAEQAARRFFHAHAATEVNLESTVEVQELAFLENEFIRALERFDAGDTPSYSPDDGRQAEDEMQAAFARTQADKARKWGTVTVEAIGRTQRLWLSYRNAWLAFAKTKYPTVSEASWQTWLARDRAEVLRRFTLMP